MYYVRVPQGEPRPDELYHHGIQGMHWGKRNGPPYPLDYKSHSSEEKRQNTKKELSAYTDSNGEQSLRRYKKTGKTADIPKKGDDARKDREDERKASRTEKGRSASEKVLKSGGSQKASEASAKKNSSHPSKGNLSFQDNLGLTDEQVKKLKTAGIIAGTTAAVVLAAYAYKHRPQFTDFNRDLIRRPVKLGPKLFQNRRNGDYVGDLARKHGYREITAEYLRSAIKSPNRGAEIDYNKLIKDVRSNQIMEYARFPHPTTVEPHARRRLSCWSASNSYFMSAMTGKEFASKSFENLADFNDFGKLYTEKPEIFTVTGRRAKDFVGKFGKLGYRKSTENTNAVTKNLVKNIFDNIDETNNLSADGSRTIGFINAAYHSDPCTHQFNFEMVHGSGKIKELFIADGYTGERYKVGKLLENGTIKYDATGMKIFNKEIHHYNIDSIRFYAPKLESINPEMMANVILGKL